MRKSSLRLTVETLRMQYTEAVQSTQEAEVRVTKVAAVQHRSGRSALHLSLLDGHHIGGSN